MVSEDKKGAMIIIKLALVVFFILFLVYLIKVDDPNAQWAILWLFLLGVFAKLKHKLIMKSIVQQAAPKAVKPAKTVAKARKK